VVAGPIVNHLSYRWLFWIPMALLGAAALAAYLVVPESRGSGASGVNWLGGVLLCGWLIALLLPVSEGPTWGWASGRTVGLLVAAGALAVLWVVVEARSANPLIDMRMMRVPVVWTANFVAILLGVAMYSVFAFVPQFLQAPRSTGYGFGASITESGLLLLPNSGGTFLVGMVCGRLTVRHGGRAVLLAGTFVTVLALVLLVVARDQKWEVLLSQALFGAGTGLAFAAMSGLIVEGVPVEQTGVASGMNANIRTIGGSIGAAVMSSVITGSARGGLPTEAGYTHGFLVPAVAGALAVGAALFVPRGLRHPEEAELEEALPHPELGVLAGGTLLGDEPE
jgi:predicted MFS family arabinose efflux permease